MPLFFEILLVGLVLSADSFSAALAMGFKPHTKKDVLKFAVSSGSAEAIVAFLGAVLGSTIIAQFDSIDHWISFFLITAVALHMIWEGIEEIRGNKDEEEGEKSEKQFHSFTKVLIVSFATSLDAFAVGVSLGTTGKPLLPFIGSIGIWAFISTVVGMALARKVSEKFGAYFAFLGAGVLIFLAFDLLH